VRTNLLKFLRLLPSQDVADSAEFALLYVRAGMTHLAAEIRNDALNVLEWLVSVAGDSLVSCPGGWAKTLKAFMSMLGWATSAGGTKWSAAAKATFGKGGKDFPRQILVLAQFLKAGLSKEVEKGDGGVKRGKDFPIWDTEMNGIPRQANAFAHLNLFGVQRDEESEMYTERSARQRVFNRRFQAAVEKGVESAKKEAGEMGRAGAVLGKVVLESMKDFEEVDQDA
jgi:pre-rRNA-processing protein IPI1